MSDELSGLPGRVQAELTRLRAEREMYTAEQDRLKARLAETEQELADQRAAADAEAARERELAALTARAAELAEENAVLTARAEALAGDVDVLRHERGLLREELAGCRQERDRLRLRLLDAELAVAGSEPEAESTGTVDAERAALAEQRAAALAQELTATRQTVSWRVTAPLRKVRRKMGQQ